MTDFHSEDKNFTKMVTEYSDDLFEFYDRVITSMKKLQIVFLIILLIAIFCSSLLPNDPFRAFGDLRVPFECFSVALIGQILFWKIRKG